MSEKGKQRAVVAFATASDLPEELFERILDFIEFRDIYHEDIVQMSKKDIGSCALVCRYWAHRCRPRIFKELTLRCRKDVQDLCKLLDQPNTKILTYISDIILQHRGTGEPWVHLVPILLRPRLSENLEWLVLKVDSPVSEGHAFKSPFEGLPGNTIPRSLALFTSLTLTNLNLRAFRDLYQLVGQLPPLRELSCTNITWPAVTPSDVLVLPSPRISCCLGIMSISKCTSIRPFLRMLFGPRRSHLFRSSRKTIPKVEHGNVWLHFDDDLVDTLHDLLQAVGTTANVIDLEVGERVFTRTNSLSVQFLTERGVSRPDYPFLWLDLIRDPNMKNRQRPDDRKLQPFADPDDLETAPAMVEHFSINFRSPGVTTGDLIEPDWEAFDRVASSIPGLGKAIIGFRERSDLAWFVEQRQDLLVKLREKKLLKTCYYHRDFGWLGLHDDAHAYAEEDVWILEDFEGEDSHEEE